MGSSEGCYSNDYKHCFPNGYDLTNCDTIWLPNGSQGNCVALWGDCTSNASSCCGPAECFGSITKSCVPPFTETSIPTTAPTPAPTDPPSPVMTPYPTKKPPTPYPSHTPPTPYPNSAPVTEVTSTQPSKGSSAQPSKGCGEKGDFCTLHTDCCSNRCNMNKNKCRRSS